MTDVTAVEHIRANAEMVRSAAIRELGVEFSYDRTGVKWLDG
jgi:hypothetical protein